jgi:hypothetical protein
MEERNPDVIDDEIPVGSKSRHVRGFPSRLLMFVAYCTASGVNGWLFSEMAPATARAVGKMSLSSMRA